MRPTHAQRLERWLGPEVAGQLSESVRHWYGPPIAVAGVPGGVWACGGGDFVGPVEAGGFASLADYVADRMQRRSRRVIRALDRWFRENRAARFHAGFASLAEVQEGLRDPNRFQSLVVNRFAVSAGANASCSHWPTGLFPAAGAAAGAAPGGTVPTSATAGAIVQRDAASGETLHVIGGKLACTVQANLLLYDRLFAVAKTMSSTGTEAVTGVPTRYQNTTPGTEDSAEGNFLFVEVSSSLPATAHNWTTCLYTDQAGNTGATLPVVGGISAAAAGRLDHALAGSQWFMPLAAGDSGIKALEQMQCSASVTGGVDFVIGHPLALIPTPLEQAMWVANGINSALSFARVFDAACLATLDITRSATGANSVIGNLHLLSSG